MQYLTINVCSSVFFITITDIIATYKFHNRVLNYSCFLNLSMSLIFSIDEDKSLDPIDCKSFLYKGETQI